jgi:hypothetical protein
MDGSSRQPFCIMHRMISDCSDPGLAIVRDVPLGLAVVAFMTPILSGTLRKNRTAYQLTFNQYRSDEAV